MNKSNLVYIEGIAGEELITYMLDKMELQKDPAGPCIDYSRQLIENVIAYGRKHKTTSKDSMLYFLCDILPDIEAEEAAAFISDELLTDNGKALKSQFWGKYGHHTETPAFFYFFDCLDGLLSEKYWSFEELQEILTKKTEDQKPFTEKDIIRTAANYEATLYRYERDAAGNYINEACLYDCGGF